MRELKADLLACLKRNDWLRAGLMPGFIQDSSFPMEKYVENILEISSKVWNRCGRFRNDPVYRAETISFVLFSELGIEGYTLKYKKLIDDPTQFFLHLALEKRHASPLVLSILYMIIAQQVGLYSECLCFPNNYILEVKDVAGNFYVDPFSSGKLINREEFQRRFRASLQKNRLISSNLYERASAHQLVGRLIQQVKHAYILKGDAFRALRAVELLTSLYPESPELTRDRGILYCEMEYFSKAIEDLRFYLDQRPQAEDIKEIKKLTHMLKGYRETVN